MEQGIFCVYYPTTTVFVDDNEAFLENIQLKIGHRTPCVLYSDSKAALQEIQEAVKKNNELKDVIGIDTESDEYARMSSTLPIQYNIANMFKHIYNKTRFAEISVIVVDFEMPKLNGEQLCRLLRKCSRAKIIMLSGEADDCIAVRLFNDRLIDQFISKGKPDWDEVLIDSIKAMQRFYFEELTFPIVNVLAYDEDSCLGDPAFIEFFHNLCRDMSISSYYLFELSGSFLLFDDAGTPSWLIVKTLNELEQIADEIETEAAEELVESIRKGEMVPYFSHLSDYLDSQGQDFARHLYKASSLKGKKEYRYAVVKDLADFPLLRKEILSFNDYLDEN